VAARRYRGQEVQVGDHVSRRDDGPDRLDERGFADVAGGVGVRARAIAVAQSDRLQGRSGVDGRLEQGGVKRLEGAPERGRALGEHRDEHAALERRDNRSTRFSRR
jgi:hypothetical protein